VPLVDVYVPSDVLWMPSAAMLSLPVAVPNISSPLAAVMVQVPVQSIVLGPVRTSS
jgi:hypothetical protein